MKLWNFRKVHQVVLGNNQIREQHIDWSCLETVIKIVSADKAFHVFSCSYI